MYIFLYFYRYQLVTLSPTLSFSFYECNPFSLSLYLSLSLSHSLSLSVCFSLILSHVSTHTPHISVSISLSLNHSRSQSPTPLTSSLPSFLPSFLPSSYFIHLSTFCVINALAIPFISNCAIAKWPVLGRALAKSFHPT